MSTDGGSGLRIGIPCVASNREVGSKYFRFIAVGRLASGDLAFTA
jgi:hypothetical protein